jgi:hypothetical protein
MNEKRELLIVDTNIVSCYLQIKKPSAEWNVEKISSKFEAIRKNGGFLVIPLPVVFEVANQVSNLGEIHDKALEKQRCTALLDLLDKKFSGTSPWLKFNEQEIFWRSNKLQLFLKKWEEKIYEINFVDLAIIAITFFYKKIMQKEDLLCILFQKINFY